MKIVALAVLVVVSACQPDRTAKMQGGSAIAGSAQAGSAAVAAFEWPVPVGWRVETIPFPLDFAPDIPYRGVEELRFPPGMFDPAAPMYFSYSFAFWLEGTPDLSAAGLEENLRRYFVGLTRAVGEEKKLRLDPQKIGARLTADDAPVASVNGHSVRRLTGTISTYDPFGSGKEISLMVAIWVWRCSVAQREVALFVASPKPANDPAWKELEARRDAFACHKGP